MRHQGEVAIITGAASGIGAATASRLGSEGALVGLIDQDESGLADTTEQLDASRSVAVRADVSDEGDIAAAVRQIHESLGRPTVLVTAAGIFHHADLAMPHEVALDDFVRVLSVNLVGTFLAIKHTTPHLVDGGGSIVTIASTAALRGHGMGSGYTASKGGVDALTRLVAVRYGPAGVRANCICPGGTDTPMTGGVMNASAVSDSPLGVYARPDEIAAVISFAASSDASHLTGQTIAVEGGATVT